MPPARRTAITAILVVGWYLAVALWCVRAILPAFATTIVTGPAVPPVWRQITAADQKLVVAVVTANARALPRSPAAVLDGPQCHPLRRALMLGQHELGEGMLGVIPYALTGDPVATYNVVMVLSLLLPGLAMHALVRDWTGSAAAAFVAGTLFATHPSRIGDVVHLSAIGNYWTVVALLFLTRFFARPRWPAALALGLAAAAQTLESIYPLIPHAVLCGVVGAALAWRHRGDLGRLAPMLAVVAACVVGAAAIVLGPYLRFAATWGSLAGRESLFYVPADLAPGRAAFGGVVASVLALVGLAAGRRIDGAAPRPRAALLLAGLVILWIAVTGLPLPGIGRLPPLFTLLADVVPGFAAVRRGGAAISGWHLVVVVFAGYGVAALVRGRGPVTVAIVGALVTALALAEVFVPQLARASFGRTFGFEAYDPRPPAAVRALFPALGPGAVLDVPYELAPGRFFRMADFVLAGAYHGKRVAACYNSFRVGVQEDVMRYAARVLAEPRAADALAALGIGTAVHHLLLPARMPLLPPGATPAHLVEIGRAAGQVLYRLPPPPPTTSDPAALELRLARPPSGAAAAIDVVFRNRGALLYRHPEPIEPAPFVVRWSDAAGRPLGEAPVAVLRPSALPAGEELARSIAVPPPPGTAARLALAEAGAPGALADIALRP
jgi:hypothetical protein